MDISILHFYRIAREQQFATYGSSIQTDQNGTTWTTGGSAAFGQHAYAAFMYAKGQIRFRKDLKQRINQNKKRSAAAKRGWKTRRAAA
jgi:hypothetical protein